MRRVVDVCLGIHAKRPHQAQREQSDATRVQLEIVQDDSAVSSKSTWYFAAVEDLPGLICIIMRERVGK